MKLLLALGATAAAALVALGAIGVAVARYAVLGGPQRKLTVLGRPAWDVVRLPRIDATTQPATFGLEDAKGSLAVVGEIVALTPDHIDRQIEPNAAIGKGDAVQLAGNVFGPDSPLARSATEVSWEGPSFTHRVWDFGPQDADGGVWFVHVHGLGASPAGTLRSVDAANRLGYRSIVVSLDGNPDMFARVRGVRASALERVIAAIDHARSRGAARVILVGWSFGGQISLQAAAGREDVAAFVLVSPCVDLLHTIRAESKVRGIPRFVAELGIAVLTSPSLARLARVDRSMKRSAGRTEVAEHAAVLLFYSTGDQTISNAGMAAIVSADERMTVVESPASPHTMEWNADPELFKRALEHWLTAGERRADA